MSRARLRSIVLTMLVALVLPASALATPPPVTPGAVISNGTVMIGVTQYGGLGYNCVGAGDSNCPAAAAGNVNGGAGPATVGLRYVPLNTDAIADGCVCEGWGVADATTGLTGGANESTGYTNITPVSFVHDATSAVATVDISDPAIPGYALRVVQNFHPSSVTPNLYEVSVTITNTGTHDISDLRFRRSMDWDIEPTNFDEWVTIANTAASRQLLWDGDDGFVNPNPLEAHAVLSSGSVCGVGYTGPCEFKDLGAAGVYPTVTQPSDHGASFDFGFGALSAGASRSFKTYYGAAPSEDSAVAAVGAQGIGVYSLGEPDCGNSADARYHANTLTGMCAGLAPFAGVLQGLPNTFTFGFVTADADVSVSAAAPAATVANGSTTATGFAVANAGPDAAPGVHLSVPVPAGLTFASATSSMGTCSYVAPNVVCDLGSLPSGATATVTINLTGAATGDATLVATTTSLANDQATGNNAATTVISVTAAAVAPPATTPLPGPGNTPLRHSQKEKPAARADTSVKPLSVVARGTTFSVGCALTSGLVASCNVTLLARVDGHMVVVGKGSGAFRNSSARARVGVDVTLNALGRTLARRPGGLHSTVRSTIRAVGKPKTYHVTAATQVVLPSLLVLSGDLLFDISSAVVKPAALHYITALTGKVMNARTLVCDGYTDDQGASASNLTLGLRRAAAVCAIFKHRTGASTRNASYGEANPRASNANAGGRAQNRRVEIHVGY